MTATVTLESPIRIVLERVTKADRKMALNLNSFRNNHHAVNNSVKRAYHELMLPVVEGAFHGVSVGTPIRIDYSLFVGTRKKLDISNVLCIVDKNFQDVLVEAGIIEDDNYDYVTDVRFKFGGYDKGNEHVLITVYYHEFGETL